MQEFVFMMPFETKALSRQLLSCPAPILPKGLKQRALQEGRVEVSKLPSPAKTTAALFSTSFSDGLGAKLVPSH